MGRYYSRTGYFDKPAVDRFAAPEYLPEGQARLFNLVGRPVQLVFAGHMARKLGCRGRLDARPYEESLH